jgi:hypothetical protein
MAYDSIIQAECKFKVLSVEIREHLFLYFFKKVNNSF